MITVTINGKRTTLEKAVTILEAAKMAGIHIPTLCHDDLLEPYGGCRLCLVEVEKIPRLLTACTQYVTDGMVILTETEAVIESRKAVLEFLLINHPLDCPYCDKAGECDLQDLAAKYGPTAGRFAEGKRKHPEYLEDPLIVRSMERCILCSKCVRMCDDVQGASAISIINRGSKSFVEPFSGGRYDCEYCGNCLTVCPVGAITSRVHRHNYRPWLIEREIETVCSLCGVGCSLVLQMRGNSIVRSVPRTGRGLNRGLLCGRGRFGYDYIQNQERLDTPLIRRDGVLQPATWSEAVTSIAQRLKEVKDEKGADALAGLISGRCTNEDAYVFQKFFRIVLGSNNIDSVAGLAYRPAQEYFEKIFGQGATANLIHGIAKSDGIFLLGGDPSSVNPVLGLQVRSAFKKGVPVVVLGYLPGLQGFTSHRLITDSLASTVVLAALVSEIRTRKSLFGEMPFFEKILQKLPAVAMSDASDRSGINVDDLMNAAAVLLTMSNPSIIIGRDIVQTSEGRSNLLFLACLAHLLNGRLYLLSESPNEQGVLDVGCQPDVLPSGRPLAVENYRKRCEADLGAEIPSLPGRTFSEIIEAAHEDKIQALYVMGENVVLGLPDTQYVRDALQKVGFLVVQDLFLSETAQLADVVLPAHSWSEKEGTYTNLERRIQFTGKAVERKGLEEWKVLTEVSKALGFDMGYGGAADIFHEIASVSRIYRNLTYEEIKKGECLWPYKGEPLRHDVHLEGVEPPDMSALMNKAETGKIYVQKDSCLFHSENATRYSSSLKGVSPEPFITMSKVLAQKLSIAQGDYVHVKGKAGHIVVSARIDSSLPDTVVYMANCEHQGIFKILAWKLNSSTRTFALDGNDVIMRKADTQ
jgi:NADH-quinone oxidoreductase chain G